MIQTAFFPKHTRNLKHAAAFLEQGQKAFPNHLMYCCSCYGIKDESIQKNNPNVGLDSWQIDRISIKEAEAIWEGGVEILVPKKKKKKKSLRNLLVFLDAFQLRVSKCVIIYGQRICLLSSHRTQSIDSSPAISMHSLVGVNLPSSGTTAAGSWASQAQDRTHQARRAHASIYSKVILVQSSTTCFIVAFSVYLPCQSHCSTPVFFLQYSPNLDLPYF